MTAEFQSEVTTATRQRPARPPSLWILIAISTISPLSMNIYLPSMAGMVTAFDTTTGMVQLTMSLFLVSIAVSTIVLGPLSDRFGRRPVVLWGMALYVVSSVLCLLAPTIEALIAARVLQALGGCTGIVLSRAIVRDLYERDKAASMIGYVTMGMAIGPMLAPVIGGLLDQFYGWRGGFYTMLVLGIAVLGIAWFNLHETNFKRSEGAGLGTLWRNMRTVMRLPVFWAFSLVVGFTSSVYFAFLGGAPFIAGNILGMPPSEMGFYFTFIAVGYIIGNFISGRIAERIGVYPMIVFGSVLPTIAVAAVSLVLILDIGHPLALFVPMFFVGLGNGICLPSAVSGAVSAKADLAGAASGLAGSIQIGSGAITSALVAWMLSDTMWPTTAWPMVGAMIVCVIATLVSVVAIKVFEERESV
ncbi:multidrug effflux MFS transporter [Roseibium aggregatum]|uniref:Bcr/CflA family efflux transporter n=1 Tax=Roseibium aggregatum TaxID=187304 RepID=A0A926NZM4_9HYPH|nr:multidrug effflux MFS transporter [Roseibium aggregatum]MBD1546693.1 multidrug effflux MFS transporter [Roseibium aggregatum]